MKAVVAAFNQEKALVGAFSVITNLRMELFEALVSAFPPMEALSNTCRVFIAHEHCGATPVQVTRHVMSTVARDGGVIIDRHSGVTIAR